MSLKNTMWIIWHKIKEEHNEIDNHVEEKSLYFGRKQLAYLMHDREISKPQQPQELL